MKVLLYDPQNPKNLVLDDVEKFRMSEHALLLERLDCVDIFPRLRVNSIIFNKYGYDLVIDLI